MSTISQFLNVSNISFYIAFFGILGMIAMKAHELRSGKQSFISRLTHRSNPVFQNTFTQTKTFISYFNRKTALALIQWIAYHILSWMRKFYIKLRGLAHMHPPSKKVLDMVRGRGEAKKNGGSSIYLKMISEKGEEIPEAEKKAKDQNL